jgi:AcrR family transcriptional regulator
MPRVLERIADNASIRLLSTAPKCSRLDPGQRREQVLDAANALFAERAYDGVSIEGIASAAGVTRG